MPKKPRIDALKLKKDSVIDHMRNLLRHPSYEVWMGLMAQEQHKIIDDGKKNKDSASWAELKGFDRGFFLVSIWANKDKEGETEQVSPIDN